MEATPARLSHSGGDSRNRIFFFGFFRTSVAKEFKLIYDRFQDKNLTPCNKLFRLNCFRPKLLTKLPSKNRSPNRLLSKSRLFPVSPYLSIRSMHVAAKPGSI